MYNLIFVECILLRYLWMQTYNIHNVYTQPAITTNNIHLLVAIAGYKSIYTLCILCVCIQFNVQSVGFQVLIAATKNGTIIWKW
jgi:hypothetical protein